MSGELQQQTKGQMYNDARKPLALSVKRVSAGRGLDWIVEGFQLFWGSAGLWVAAVMICLILSIVLMLVPVVGDMAVIVLSPIFMAGFMLGANAQQNSGNCTFESLFISFKHQSVAQLFLLGFLSLFLMLLLGLLLRMMFASVFALMGWEVINFDSDPVTMIGILAQLMMPMLVAAMLLVPITMLLWFAPALVALQGRSAIESLQLSFKGCLINTASFFIYGLVLMFLSILAALPLGLGYLVLIPVTITSIYAAYRDIYTAG